jgi:N-acetylglucosamine-6-phosphate deacetylase
MAKIAFRNFVAGCSLASPGDLLVNAGSGTVISAATEDGSNDAASLGSETEVVDCDGHILIPGFIDLQFNGGFGIDFSRADTSREQIGGTLHRLLQYGVTAILPTLISSSPDVYRHALAEMQFLWNERHTAVPRMLGLHLEGPFLNPERKGAHPTENLRCPCTSRIAAAGSAGNSALVYGPTVSYLDSEPSSSGDRSGFVRLVTLAPEIDGGLDTIRKLSSHGVVSAIGHTTATYPQCEEAMAAGATMITHLANAMPPLSHRGDAGPIALLGRREGSPFFSLIFDGAHVLPPTAVMAYRSNPDRCVLVTDAMPALGLLAGSSHTYGDNKITLFAGKETGPDGGFYPGPHAVVEGTQTLAGAVAPLDLCLRNLCEASGCWRPPKDGEEGRITDLEAFKQAVKTVTANPAAMLKSKGRPVVPGQPDIELGCLDKPGKSVGDIVLLNKSTLQVERVFVGGRLRWSREGGFQ